MLGVKCNGIYRKTKLILRGAAHSKRRVNLQELTGRMMIDFTIAVLTCCVKPTVAQVVDDQSAQAPGLHNHRRHHHRRAAQW